MSKKSKSSGVWQSLFAPITVAIAFVAAYFIYQKVLGNPVNFEGGNNQGHPLQGNLLGLMYKGGVIVPILLTIIITLLVFVVERTITLRKVQGKASLNVFVSNLQDMLAEDRIEDAIVACDVQKGSLANVMKAGLTRYRDLQSDDELKRDEKITSMKQALEEATALELPSLSRNMVMLSTIASISVLVGLIGTVIGMIRAFAALAQSGAPDALALSTGISEALVNTALGITGSTLAIIFFNIFSVQIDDYVNKIDEAGFSLTQSFAASVRKR